MARAFGILGAIAAVLHWRYTISAAPALLPASWSTVLWEGSAYAVAGFVVGWVVGFALTKTGPGWRDSIPHHAVDANREPIVAALAGLTDDKLHALIATANGGPQTAPGLLAWLEHAADWILSGRAIGPPVFCED
jgi:hypothetical protein